MPKIEKKEIDSSKVRNLKDARGESRIEVFQRLQKEMLKDPNFLSEEIEKDLDLKRKVEKEKLPPNLKHIKGGRN